MNKLRLCIIAFCAVCTSNIFAQKEDDFGLDYCIEAEKKICKGIDFGLEANMRTQDNSSSIERYGIGGTLNVKLLNTKTFDVKFNAGWEYIWQRLLPETKEHYGEDTYMTPEGPKVVSYYDGFNLTLRSWRPRHRTTVGISANYSPNKRWTFSLKESVQYNHYASYTRNKERYRLDDPEDLLSIKYVDTKVEQKSAKDRFVLRSKISVQYDVRHSPFAPFASVDYGCGLNYSTSKWKLTAGTDYKLNKTNKLSAFYRFQHDNDDDEPNGHIIGVAYSVKF